ncbi:MAG: TetR/AcrR family transcriptional regulator [Solirubrobacterales bacterium]|nr:TetR/AcrR family transcriptional regulator [Solirubrobacterales bacterium]MBV9603775.1 TetR/AcrR family transcriptional regulator [Solirubrobacterales bacterium]MBV9837702.1 TetR/AcrR family transcriptional regulator [Solirubrobacterales bacterium]
MPRPKAYERDAVVIAARDLFWERGYEACSISDLEQRTGLNRSSLYQEFGSKHQLLEQTLDCYADQIIAPLLGELSAPGSGLERIASLFMRLAHLFRSRTRTAKSGCLLVNSIAELASSDDRVRAAGVAYRDRLRSGFATALENACQLGEIDAESAQARGDLLAAALMGVWLSVRIDPGDASRLCETIAAQVESWRRS